MKTLQRLTLTALAAAALAAALPGCAPLVLGGAAVTALVAVDRRTSGAQLEDETLELRGAARVREVLGSRGHVNINSFNRQVLLTGEVPDEAARVAVDQAISRLDNVRGVVNELAVMATTSITQRSNDTFITGKVKAALVDARDLSAPAFRVVTERGTVYLMGLVTQREAERATAVVRQVGGVQRVVRAFEIISEEDLARMQPPQGGPQAPARAASAAR